MKQTKTARETETEIVPFGHIKESTLKLQVSKTTFTDNNGRVAKVNIVVYYEWLKDPMNKRTDGISVNWDNSVFTFLAGSFYSYDQLLISGILSKKLNECSAPDLAQQGGIGYSAMLSVHADGSAGWARGTASFYIVPTTSPVYETTNSTNANTTSINVNYVHDRTPIWGSISFSVSGFGVTVNAPTFNDNLSTSLNFYYHR